MRGRSATVSAGGGGPPPSGEDGVNEMNNTPFDGDSSSTAYGYDILTGGDGTASFVEADAADHRAVRLVNSGNPGSAARIGQDFTRVDGTQYTFSIYCKAVGTVDESDDNVVLNWYPYSAFNIVSGSRPKASDLVPGERVAVTVEAVGGGTVGLRIGPSLQGDVTLERPMLDQSSELRGYVPSVYDPPPAPATIDFGVGVPLIGVEGVMPRVMKYNNYTVSQGIIVSRTGTITAVGFEIASNNPDDINPDGTPISRTKSMGTGVYTLNLKLTVGQPAISGDNIDSRCYPLGSVPLADVLIRPDFSQILRTGSVDHDRKSNLGNGDRRRWHWWTLPTPLDVTAGDRLCLVGYAKSSGADSDYISYTNGPTTSPYSASKLMPPWTLSPARARSPQGGNIHFGCVATETFSTTSVEANKRYTLRPEYCQMALLYSDGDKIGLGLRESNGLRSQAVVGGSNRLRHRFRHLGNTFSCRYVWLPCYYAGSAPSSSLTLNLVDETTATTWVASAPAQPVGGTNDLTKVHPFGGTLHSSSSYPDYVRFDLGAARTITSGNDYRLELSSTDGSRLYTCFAARHSLTAMDVTDSPGPPRTGLPARAGQNNPDLLSYVERSTNGGGSWAGLTLYTSNRTDLSLAYWLEPTVTVETLFLNPLSSESAFHRPIGSGATFSSTAPFAGYSDGTVADDNVFSNQSVLVTEGAPVTFTWSGALSGVGLPFSIRFPSSGFPTYVTDPTYDCVATVVNDLFIGHDIYKIDTRSGVRKAAIHREFDIRGLGHGTVAGWDNRVGSSAAGNAVFAGTIRKHEFETPGLVIGHAHHIALPWTAPNAFLNRRFQLPAVCTDGFAETNSTTAPCAYGELLAIKASRLSAVLTAINGMSVSSAAKEMLGRYATAFCHYGIYVVDSAGQISFRADGVLDATLKAAFVSFIRTILWADLYRVTNSVTGATGTVTAGAVLTGSAGTLTYPAGGGTPLAANTAWDA